MGRNTGFYIIKMAPIMVLELGMKSSFLKWIRASGPLKKFPLEVALMCEHSKNKRLRKYFRNRLFYRYGCDISHKAYLHKSTVFPHPLGIIIGSRVAVDSGVVIYQ